MVILTSDNFRNSIASGVVVVDMYADWCGPCRALSPILEELSQKVDGVTFAKLNVDDSSDIAMEYGVMSIPTVIIFKDGKEQKRIIGLYPRDYYIEVINDAKNS
ncbi:MAG: thioredoxin [Candidatus Dojkabacteria bacterium]|nr:MAG: thioredoxin [Candidatus Dojkabacteria bacterium]